MDAIPTIGMLIVLTVLIVVSTPVLAIWMILRYKLQRLKMEEAIKEQKHTNEQLQQLQRDYEQFLLGFDATLKRLDSRLSRLEDEHKLQTYRETTDEQEIRLRRQS